MDAVEHHPSLCSVSLAYLFPPKNNHRRCTDTHSQQRPGPPDPTWSEPVLRLQWPHVIRTRYLGHRVASLVELESVHCSLSISCEMFAITQPTPYTMGPPTWLTAPCSILGSRVASVGLPISITHQSPAARLMVKPTVARRPRLTRGYRLLTNTTFHG